MLGWGKRAGLPKVGGGGGQFLNQIKGIEWPLERSVVRRGGGRFLRGRTRIRMGIIFLCQGLFEVIRKKGWLELQRG